MVEDEYFNIMKPYLEDRKRPRPKDISARLHDCNLIEGLLWKEKRLYVPATVRKQVHQEGHDSSLGGHFGTNKTEELIRRDSFWPNMADNIRDYISTCDMCQRTKKRTHAPYGELQPLPIPQNRWESVSMDFITGLPVTKPHGYNLLMVLIDRLTKMTHLLPCFKRTVRIKSLSNSLRL